MQINALMRVIWPAGFLGHLVLLAVLFARHRAKQLPWFTALIGFQVVQTTLLFLVRGNDQQYMVMYLATSIIDPLMQFAVAYEIARSTFQPMGRWASDTRRAIVLLAVGSLALAAGMTWLAAPFSASWTQVLITRLNFFTSTLMTELVLGMVVLSVTAGLPWKTDVANIAYGLGVYAILGMAIATAHTLYGRTYRMDIGMALSYTRMCFYVVCQGYWIATLWQESPEPRELPAEVLQHLRSLQSRFAYDLYAIRKWRKL